MTYLNVRVNEYTNRVLGVIKAKYGLKDKGQALDKLAAAVGEEYVEPEVREELVKQLIEEADAHIKKYGFRKMSHEELDRLSGLK
ncbi:DUF2683 family protein [Candidatus Micrarchaeota archaeon]|nr:DUF2683 family protein [Candidatus Micrarchaeota archaeon]